MKQEARRVIICFSRLIKYETSYTNYITGEIHTRAAHTDIKHICLPSLYLMKGSSNILDDLDIVVN